MKDTSLMFLVGLEVKADHPITCLNPTETFLIRYAKIDERGKLYVRGEETMWFHASLITRAESTIPVQPIA